MKSEMVYCKIMPDCNNLIANWVCKNLDYDTEWLGENYTIGIERAGKMIAGLIFNNYRKNTEVWLTIYTENPLWCNKRVLRYIFDEVCFGKLNCKRVSVLVSKDNTKSLRLCKGLGFQIEGLLRQYRENGEDCYIMGMLKNEFNWRK